VLQTSAFSLSLHASPLFCSDYWAYFKPIQEYMPKNCSSDVQSVIAYLDSLYAVNDTGKLQELKTAFGLGGLSHIDDFASARKLGPLTTGS